jgi:RNA polymerase-interacting CarD/CdnL/TRCF family regulator
MRQFNVDDLIVHPRFGVGCVVKIEKTQFSEEELALYYKITLPKQIIWVPVEAQEALGLRLVTAESDLDQYRNLLKSPALILSKNHRQRHLELDQRLKDGSFQALCEVVRDLAASDRQKPLSAKDTSLLRKARESLCEEWATAAGVSIAEAVKEVEALLRSDANGRFVKITESERNGEL